MLPVIELRWGRGGYLASVIFPIFEHIRDITDLPKPIRHAGGHCRGNPQRLVSTANVVLKGYGKRVVLDPARSSGPFWTLVLRIGFQTGAS